MLLAHRLGVDRVTSVEVDPQIAAQARTAALDDENVGRREELS
ncbi:MAG: hypothetical protein ACRDRL_14600 [Sciscionella sp.]